MKKSHLLLILIIILFAGYFIVGKNVSFNAESNTPKITREFIELEGGKTEIRIKLERSDEPFFIMQDIPKSVASHVDELVIEPKPTIVLRTDPLIVWYFPEVLEG